MRFLRRSLVGLFLLSLTLGLLAWAGILVRDAVQAYLTDTPRIPQARERVFAVNVVPVRLETVAPVMTAFGEIQSRRTLELRSAVGGTLRPYAAYTVFGGDQDDLTYVTEAGSRSFEASELLNQDQLSLGLDYGAEGGHGLGGRLEAASNFDGDSALRLNLSFNF